MLIASWKVRAALPVALVLAWAAAPAHGQTKENQRPVISAITAVQVPGQKFRIFGTVTDDTPGACGVSFTGAARGVVLCDATGHFDATFDVAAPGNTTATAGDGMLDSDPVTVGLTNAAPTTGCRAVIRGTTLTITGTVTDEAPAGLIVTLTGSKAVTGLTATVQSNGTWSVSTTILSGSHGNITATVTDWYGLTGNGYTTY